jgi:superfamily II DNA helicase RecQ
VIDYAENVSPGVEGWRELYVAQEKQKLAQLEQMLRFAESDQCRMLALVSHFGDTGDREGPCGICDFCAPAGCVAQSFRSATGVERAAVYRTLEALKKGGPRASGRLHRDLCPAPGLDRDSFELTLGAMARAGLVTLTESSFEKDGKRIDYRTVQLTAAGRSADESTPIDFVMKQEILAAPRGRKRKRTKSAVPAPAPGAEPRASASRQPSQLETTLRAWRLAEAKKRSVPAFRVLTDKTLQAIASARPASAAELLAIPGIGLSTIERYGAQIFRILERATG